MVDVLTKDVLRGIQRDLNAHGFLPVFSRHRKSVCIRWLRDQALACQQENKEETARYANKQYCFTR